MLGDTFLELNVTGEKIRADGFFGQKDGLHSVAFYLQDFTGRVFIEGTLASEPVDGVDWFAIFLDGTNSFIEYPLDLSNPTGVNGDTMVDAFTFQGNFVYLRVRIDRSFVVPIPVTDPEKALLGSIGKVLLNH